MNLLQLENYYANFTFCSAVISNSILLYLLFKNPNKKLGNYRYLMFSFSIVALFFSLIDFLNKPLSHVSGGAYVVFSMNTLGLSVELATYLNALNCSCFGITVALLSIHFIYRYLAVCRPHLMNLFTWPYATMWFIYCIGITVEWLLAAEYFASRSKAIDQVIEPNIRKIYNISVDSIIYQGNVYYKIDSNGVKSFDIANILFVLNIDLIDGTCLSIILFCGIATSRKMKSLGYASQKTNDLQRQLFRALVVQTIIPFMTMFVPAGVIIISPFFEVTIGPMEVLMMSFITTYPVLDPLAVMYFVKDYRQFICNVLTCRKKITDSEQSTASVSGTRRQAYIT